MGVVHKGIRELPPNWTCQRCKTVTANPVRPGHMAVSVILIGVYLYSTYQCVTIQKILALVLVLVDLN